jgi:hypothetical protein
LTAAKQAVGSVALDSRICCREAAFLAEVRVSERDSVLRILEAEKAFLLPRSSKKLKEDLHDVLSQARSEYRGDS